MMTCAPVDDEIRERLNQVIEIIAPLAKSFGQFQDLQALRIAILLSRHALERADLLANYRLPPTR